MLAAVPSAVQFLQFPAVVLIERLRRRRAISVWAAAIGRAFLIAAAAAPLFGGSAGVIDADRVRSPSGRPRRPSPAAPGIPGCATWCRKAAYGRFFGSRAAANTAVAMALALLSGILIDRWKQHDARPFRSSPIAALFLISAVIGFLGVWLLSITPDQPMAPPTARPHPLGMLTAPFRDQNFRRLMVFLVELELRRQPRDPFFAVYMLTSLGYSMTAVVILTTASQLSNLAAVRLWGNVIDRFSNKAVLGYSAPLFLLCTLAWTFTGLPWIAPFTF